MFNLAGLQIAQTPTNSTNGLALGLHGIVVSAGTSDLTVKALTSDNQLNPPVWKIAVNSSTPFQGVNGLAQIAAGVPVDMDAAIQADGSLVATRVAVIDSDATNISALAGPGLYVSSAVSALQFFGSEWQGQRWAQQSQIYSLPSSTFSISGALSNLASLPFAATFNNSTMVPGQNIYITTHQASVPMGSNYAPASSLMLLPQTVNGTVTAVSTQGAFTAYTVSLASYNLFSNLAVQPGQTTRITNPDSMVVYVGSDTTMLNSGAVGVGETLRFNGLVFDDQGTLRMDCAQVSDGVTP